MIWDQTITPQITLHGKLHFFVWCRSAYRVEGILPIILVLYMNICFPHSCTVLYYLYRSYKNTTYHSATVIKLDISTSFGFSMICTNEIKRSSYTDCLKVMSYHSQTKLILVLCHNRWKHGPVVRLNLNEFNYLCRTFFPWQKSIHNCPIGSLLLQDTNNTTTSVSSV